MFKENTHGKTAADSTTDESLNTADSMPRTQSLRVLHVCKVYLPVKGGIQKVVHSLATLVSSFSHCVITTGEDGAVRNECIDDVQVNRYHSYGQISSMPIAPSLIRAVISAKDSDLIAIHYPFPLAEVAVSLRPFSPPIVVHWHSEVIAQKKLKWLVMPFTLLTLVRAKSIVITSNKMLTASRYLKLFKRKISVIPYGLSPIDQLEKSAPDHESYFVLVGRHVSYKGIDVAIRAAKHMKARLIVAGDGPLYDKHVKLAHDEGISDKIEFIRHACDEEISHLISNAIALIVSSVRENEAFAIVQLEAMRLNTAIINTDLNSSVPWVARDGKEALTVAPRDVSALAEAMQRLYSDRKLANYLGSNGLSRFNAHFSADQFSRSVNRLYHQITSDN